MVYIEQIYRSQTSPQQVFVQFYALHASSGSVVWSLPLQKIATPYEGFKMRAGSGVFDFATALGHREDETQFDPAYDSGDGLHPNDTGYQRMAESISTA